MAPTPTLGCLRTFERSRGRTAWGELRCATTSVHAGDLLQGPDHWEARELKSNQCVGPMSRRRTSQNPRLTSTGWATALQSLENGAVIKSLKGAPSATGGSQCQMCAWSEDLISWLAQQLGCRQVPTGMRPLPRILLALGGLRLYTAANPRVAGCRRPWGRSGRPAMHPQAAFRR